MLLNDEYNGYYRSQYTGRLLSGVLEEPQRLSPSERLGLLRDASALVRSGDLSYVQALELTSRFANDRNWRAFCGAIDRPEDPVGHVGGTGDLQEMASAWHGGASLNAKLGR